MAKSYAGPSNMAERISHPYICYPFMSAKVALCSTNLSSRAKTMRSLLAKPFYIPYWSKDVSSVSMRSKARRAWCATVHAYPGYYFIPIKENNPAVLRDLTEFFEDEGIDRSEFPYHKEVNKGHGRLETREIWTSTPMNDWFERDWTGIAQVFLIQKTIKEKGEERTERSYGITSVPRKNANAARVLDLKRKHWFIENRLHWRRDVTLGEDASQVRTQGAPEVVAALNGGLLALMDFRGVKNVAKQMRHFCAQPREALQLLLGKLSR